MTAPTVEPDATAPAESEKKGKKGKGKKEKGGRSNLVPAVVVAVGLMGGGYFMGGSGGAEAAPPSTIAPDIVEGPLLPIEPMTVNLAADRYLRLAVSFQMTDAYVDAVEGENGGESFAVDDASRVQDMLIATLAGRDAAGLTDVAGRDAVKGELQERANALFEGAVMDVFFTDFVIQ
ncbi:MAG: flagellar basal body-associated FliL family protein [Acidimicrobiia bacterium]|nr:flagellar basal body-associated FliL family protein [Acidimicrobiia bacterium]